MTGPRSYADPCGIARALDAVGERWALLIVRELVLGPRRFTDLRAALGASPNVLSQRLGELEAAGVVRQRTVGAALYEVTDWGRGLHPILVELARLLRDVASSVSTRSCWRSKRPSSRKEPQTYVSSTSCGSAKNALLCWSTPGGSRHRAAPRRRPTLSSLLTRPRCAPSRLAT